MRELRTINGNLIRALARWDRESFDHWYAKMGEDDEAQETLFEMYYGAFGELAVLRFGKGRDLREIAEFLATPRVPVFRNSKLPLLEAEALVRSALGERGLLEGISRELAIDIWMQLIAYIATDLDISDDLLDELIQRVEGRVI